MCEVHHSYMKFFREKKDALEKLATLAERIIQSGKSPFL
jgi:hypothetical protein